LTALGATTLKAHLETQRTVIEIGLRRLTGAWDLS
jgi:hypothetical protein